MNRTKIGKMLLPDELSKMLSNENVRVTIPNSREELIELSLGGDIDSPVYDVSFKVNDELIREAYITNCRNGIVVNYDDVYMRRRDGDCMVIGDEYPTDKPTYKDRFNTTFDKTRNETFEWLEQQEDLVLLPFIAGNSSINLGYEALLVVPKNASFFATALSDLQGFIKKDDIREDFTPKAILYVAPPFRHTHFDKKQVVVHNRMEDMHEVFSYNLYPGPSAKKGIYAVLLDLGEREGWITLHASAVEVVTPYENTFTIMHEGASGSGKSEMLEYYHRDKSGKLLLATNLRNNDKVYLDMSDESELHPISDDMALVHPSIQNKTDKKIVVADAEDGWFLRVNHIQEYGTEPATEKNSIHPKKPLVMFNIDAKPFSTALIWEPIMDDIKTKCSNPRIIMPRNNVENHVDEPVAIDVRSFGLRQPPSTLAQPNYGIAGIFHVLTPALAWIWRLVAPRGFANPSIIDDGKMSSEGVGSYWAFATGKKVDQANLLLEQILDTLNTEYILIPNQHIGSYKIGFSSQWVTREYLARKGSLKFREGQLKPSRCSLLGYSPQGIKIDGVTISRKFFDTEIQSELGDEGYDLGAKILTDFFKEELKQYLTPELNPLGRKIIETCLNDGTVEDYEKLIVK